MGNAEEALKKTAETLEKYRKNKTLVSPEDLRTKYKVAFHQLKNQLRTELEEYLKAYCLSGWTVKKDDYGAEFIEKCNKAYEDAGLAKAIGKAAFRDFDLGEVQRLAREHRERIAGYWKEYFNRHTCLYAYGQCFSEDNPHTPLIYNNLVDKFWDESSKEWITREKPPGGAVLILIKR